MSGKTQHIWKNSHYFKVLSCLSSNKCPTGNRNAQHNANISTWCMMSYRFIRLSFHSWPFSEPSVMVSMTVLTKRTKIQTTVYSIKRWVECLFWSFFSNNFLRVWRIFFNLHHIFKLLASDKIIAMCSLPPHLIYSWLNSWARWKSENIHKYSMFSQTKPHLDKIEWNVWK